MAEMSFFNVDDGFLEAITRGYRTRFLSRESYQSLIQADTLDDLKMHLSSEEFDYGPFLESLSSGDALDTKSLERALKRALVSEFHFVRAQATHPLSEFLDYITYGYMIENLCLLIKGSLKGEPAEKLIESCNPLGTFPEMVVVCLATTPQEMYESILVDTPLAPYFVGCIDSVKDLEEFNVEELKDKLYKEYLTDFYQFCQGLGGTTGEVMSGLLEFTADMRAINIAVNSIPTANMDAEKKKLLNPPFGSLYPEGFNMLAEAKDEAGIFGDLQAKYSDTFGKCVDTMQKNSGSEAEKYIEEVMMDEEVRLNELAFYEQFHYGDRKSVV